MTTRIKLWPIAVIEDRYEGTYSKGDWLAIANADELAGFGVTRVGWISSYEGPNDDDTGARTFWANPPSWIAVGDTPDEAVAALRKKLLP